jgi:hypothetical protein
LKINLKVLFFCCYYNNNNNQKKSSEKRGECERVTFILGIIYLTLKKQQTFLNKFYFTFCEEKEEEEMFYFDFWFLSKLIFVCILTEKNKNKIVFVIFI